MGKLKENFFEEISDKKIFEIEEKFIEEMLGEDFFNNPFEFLNEHCYDLSEDGLNFYLSREQEITTKQHIEEMLNNNHTDYLSQSLFDYVNDVLRIEMKEDIKNLDDDEIFEIIEKLSDYMLNFLISNICKERRKITNV